MANRSRWMALLDSSLSAAGVRKFKAERQRRVRLYPGLKPHRGTLPSFPDSRRKGSFQPNTGRSERDQAAAGSAEDWPIAECRLFKSGDGDPDRQLAATNALAVTKSFNF